jgi:hypothetical protein
MLESPDKTARAPLVYRRPSRSLFVLLTPALFKRNSTSRLYGWLMNEYFQNPEALARDLPHRKDQHCDWKEIVSRMRWLTFEDCEDVLPGCCPWLFLQP